MKKILSRNILIILLGILTPGLITYFYNQKAFGDFRFTLQYIMGSIILLSSGYLLVWNIIILRKDKEYLWLKLFFLLLAIFGILCSATILALQYGLRNALSW
jgi:hypothetical protein